MNKQCGKAFVATTSIRSAQFDFETAKTETPVEITFKSIDEEKTEKQAQEFGLPKFVPSAAAPPLSPPPVTPAFSFVDDDREPSPSRSTNSRYPNLMLNLEWLENAAKRQLMIARIIALLLAVLSVIGAIGVMVQVGDFTTGIVGIGLFPPLILFLIISPAWILYVLMMATVEFIRVIMDIERNTRK
jgi:hypothetical protein